MSTKALRNTACSRLRSAGIPIDFSIDQRLEKLERVKGIEPSSQPWEGHILPLNHTRFLGRLIAAQQACLAFIKWLRGWQLVCIHASPLGVKPADGFAQFFLDQPLAFG